jgi:hypothetical protein
MKSSIDRFIFDSSGMIGGGRYNAAMHVARCLLLLSLSLPAQAVDEADQPQATTLAQLATAADLVAVAQLRETDYRRQRGLPVSGSAYLEILIPYKQGEAGQIIEVFDRGLHEHECYFPTPDVYEEGRRYLLFLRHDPELAERYRGLPQGCAIDVLVRSDNRYALRLPVTGFDLSDPLDEFAEHMEFGDAYAVVRDEDLPPELRASMLAAGRIEPFAADEASTGPSARHWRYTSGVALHTVRSLMGNAVQRASR